MRHPFSLFLVVSVLLAGCGETSAGDPSSIATNQLTAGPVISAVTATNITQTGVVISWTLNQPGTGKIEYGTTTAYGNVRMPEELSFNYSAHVQALSGLTAGTRDHYRVTSRNQAGGTTTSADNTFTTASSPGPVISAVTATNLTQTGAVNSWTLNEPGTGRIEYGPTTAYGTVRMPEELSFTYSAHAQALSGLTAGTTYHYRVTSRNQAGGITSSADNTFTTTTPSLPGPVISAVTATNVTQSGVVISWTLNEPGTGRIEYGTTTAYGNVRLPEELSFNYAAHSQALLGLTPATTYHYRVTSRNQAGGTTSSGDNTFTTSSTTTSSTGNLPAKVIGGYFTTWEARNGVTLRSIADSTNYNLVYVAFAVGVGASSGTLRLDLPPAVANPADFKTQIAYANARGKKVVVSVGGYFDLGNQNIGYRLDSTAKVDEFMASMRDFHDNWGFNGMDWDLEQGNRPDVAGIVAASQRMRAEFGPTWIINFAPGIELNTWTGPGGEIGRAHV